MTITISGPGRNGMLDSLETTMGVSAKLLLRTGAQPASGAAASSGTILATIALPSDYMSNAAAGSKALLGTWSGTVATAGLVGHFEMTATDGTTQCIRGVVSEPWTSTKTYILNQQVHASGNVYRATVAGTSSATAPSHTTGSAADGGVTWLFLQIGTELTLDNSNLNAAQTVSVASFTLTAANA